MHTVFPTIETPAAFRRQMETFDRMRETERAFVERSRRQEQRRSARNAEDVTSDVRSRKPFPFVLYNPYEVGLA